VNPTSTSNQSSKPCTVLQYPPRKALFARVVSVCVCGEPYIYLKPVEQTLYGATVPPKKSSIRACGICVLLASSLLRHLGDVTYSKVMPVTDLYVVDARCICVRHGVFKIGLLQHTVTLGNKCWLIQDWFAATHCRTRQHTATHSNTPQHTATHRSTRWLIQEWFD